MLVSWKNDENEICTVHIYWKNGKAAGVDKITDEILKYRFAYEVAVQFV